jgi:hypothetical protein
MAINPLYDPSTDNQDISEDVQGMLNQPQSGGQMSDEDRKFLDNLMALVEAGTINLYQPSTLLNNAVYDQLPPEGQAKADQNAVLMLSKIRQIVDLEKAPMDTNYQEINLVSALRLNKERVEEFSGDVFVI